MRRFVAIIGLLCPLVAGAQPLPINAGDSLRVALRSGVLMQGTLVRQTADSVALHRVVESGEADTAFAFADLTTVEAKVGHHSVAWAVGGLGTGFLAGLSVGGLLGYASTQSCGGELCGLGGAIIAGVGSIVGAFVGLFVGIGHTTETWDIVWRPASAQAGT